MGNRAVITRSTTDSAPCIYLHWNGGRDSVDGFLLVAKYMAFTNNASDDWDEFARFLSKNFFDYGGELGMTIYREKYGQADADNGDNGVYVVDGNWNIVNRLFTRRPEQNEHNRLHLAAHILYRHLGLSKEDADKAGYEELADMGVEDFVRKAQ